MKLILYLLFLPISFIYSQQILWEKEFPSEFSQNGYINDIILDSSGNLEVIYTQTSMNPQSEFLKVNSSGELIFKKQIFKFDIQNKEKVKIPLSAKYTENGTSIFMGITQEVIHNQEQLVLPIIINYNQSGNSVDSIKYYNISDNSEFIKYGFKINSITKNNIETNNKFFNVTIEDYEKYSENPNSYNHNILVICYDSLGRWVWGNSYEKINSSNEKYILKNVIRSKDGNIIILCHRYLMSGLDWEISQLKLLVINEFGSKIISFDNQNNEKYFPKCVSEYGDGFIVLNQFATNTYNSHFISTFSKTGELIDDFIIPAKYLRMTINKLVINRNSEILLIGKYLIDSKDPTNPSDDIGKLFVVKYNSDFKKVWEIESNDLLLSENNYQDIIISENNEYVIIGYKNMNNRYISKIRDLNTDRVEDEINKNIDISITPNTTSDYIEINVSLKRNLGDMSIRIFDILGIEYPANSWHPSSEAKIRIDVSGLTPGVYFVCVGKFVRKFVKF